MLSEKVITKILEVGSSHGADFVEIFVESTTSDFVSLLNCKIEKAIHGVEAGVGIRLLYGTKQIYGFCSSFDEEDIIETANILAMSHKDEARHEIKPLKSEKLQTFNTVKIKPTKVAKTEMFEGLILMDKSARSESELIKQVEATLAGRVQKIQIANSEGLLIADERIYCRMAVAAIAVKNGEKQVGYESHGAAKGYEFIRDLDLGSLASEAARSAVLMVEAPYAPQGTMPVIIGSDFGGVIFHEACGHSLETTSVAKEASVFSGKLGKRVASEKVTAIDDGTIGNEWGSTHIDDEGLPTQKTVLIEKGILKSYMVDRIGHLITGFDRTGNGRRESYKFAPTSRMRNTYIEEGQDSLDDMIASVRKGIYAKRMGGGSVLPGTGEFNFAVREGYLIENGKLKGPVRGASLIGKGHETIRQIEMVGKEKQLSTGVCGSISGNVPTTVGQPPIKVKKIIVGGR